MWTIYERPSDHPDCFVVRRSVMQPDGTIVHDEDAATAPTLEAARMLVPWWFVRCRRGPGDDPVIVEVWL